jgi:hypothetical protein
MRRVASIAMFYIFMNGCVLQGHLVGSAPTPVPARGDLRQDDASGRTHDLYTSDENSKEYCYRLALHADTTSRWALFLGVASGALALTGAVVFAAIGPGGATTNDFGGAVDKQRNVIGLGVSGVFGVVSALFLRNAESNAHGAAASVAAIGGPETERMKRCTEAYGVVVNGRADSAKEFRSAFEAKMDRYEAATRTVAEMKITVEEKTAAADAAQAASNAAQNDQEKRKLAEKAAAEKKAALLDLQTAEETKALLRQAVTKE